MKPATIIYALLLICAGFAATASVARAATEFCPAAIGSFHMKSVTPSGKIYSYGLFALGPRSFQGTLIAETDHGWFAWTQQPVELTAMTFTRTWADYAYRAGYAISPQLTVSFPSSVTIARAWIVNARAHGDDAGWEAKGQVSCDPPDVVPNAEDQGVSNATPLETDPTPAPATAMAVAAPTAAPFPPVTCDHPFTSARVAKAVSPRYPPSLTDLDFGYTVTTMLLVAVDASGKPVDAWVDKSSSLKPFDDAAIDAAKRSVYVAAIAYCRPVSGVYTFRADFEP